MGRSKGSPPGAQASRHRVRSSRRDTTPFSGVRSSKPREQILTWWQTRVRDNRIKLQSVIKMSILFEKQNIVPRSHRNEGEGAQLKNQGQLKERKGDKKLPPKLSAKIPHM